MLLAPLSGGLGLQEGLCVWMMTIPGTMALDVKWFLEQSGDLLLLDPRGIGIQNKARMTSWFEGALEVTHAKRKLRDRIIESCFLELSRDSIGHCHTERKWDTGTSIKWNKISESFEGLHFKTLPRNISDTLSWWGSHKTQFRVARKKWQFLSTKTFWCFLHKW